MDVLTVKAMPVKSARNPYGVAASEVVEGAFADLGHERISYGHWQHSLYRHWLLVQQCNWWFPQSARRGAQ